MNDIRYMRLALKLAEKGRGFVNPNPMVGAVIVKNKKIVGRGYHRFYGGPHAETNALGEAKSKAKGATMYVTLEPCSHFGHTPPCAPGIVKSGIKKAVISTLDPNPANNGRGIKILERHGIQIKKGIMAEDAGMLNEKFFHYHKTKRPFVSLKCAMTMDGKIATIRGDSRWITGRKSHEFVHLLRHEHDAVMAGVNTIKADNPELTARLNKGMRAPYIVILDTRLSIPLESRVVKNAKRNKVIVATLQGSSFEKKKRLLSKGVRVITAPSRGGRVNLPYILKILGEMYITSILVEGGGEVIFSFLREKLADKIYFFYAPKIFGGRAAPTAVEGEGIEDISKAVRIKNIEYRRMGEDVLVTGYP